MPDCRLIQAYPSTLTEDATLDLVCSGRSLARYGDGEFALCWGRSIPCQRIKRDLSDRLQGILKSSGRCLVGIPNLRSDTPKANYWERYSRASTLMVDRDYASAFISRPDSAPWIDRPDYWLKVESLWQGQRVLLVRGSGRSLTAADLFNSEVTEIIGPSVDAWTSYVDLMLQIDQARKRERFDRVLLCLGPTATVMAVDLCAAGIQAVDVGHVGLFLRKHWRGQSMQMSEADHAMR